MSDPGSERMAEQRDERVGRLVEHLGRPIRRALDLGCGRGEALPRLGLAGVGVDVGIVRLHLATTPVAQADGARLPFPSATFDLVLAMEVFGALPTEGQRRVVAAEAVRVLEPGGVVLWYDMRRGRPGGRGTQPVTSSALAKLFPGATIEVEPITVLPGLSRSFPRRYDLLHKLGPLRSHLIGLIRPG